MHNDLYQVIFRGETEQGVPDSTVKKNLAALFKTQPEKIERLFGDKPVVIKKNVDQATALKYQAAMKKAGAVSAVQPMAPAEKTVRKSAPERKAAPPRIIATENMRRNIAFSPVLCSSISGSDAALDLNRADMDPVPFSQVRLISVFREQPDPDDQPVDSMALFIEGQKRPFLVPTDRIHFGEFPGIAGANLMQSMQNFLRFLSKNTSGLYMDRETAEFIENGSYTEINSQLEHLTALGEALENV